MMPSQNQTILASSVAPNGGNPLVLGHHTVQSRHSDRRDSNQIANGFRQNHQRKPQLSLDYQTIFSAGSSNGGVPGAGGSLNISELYSHYATSKGHQQTLGGKFLGVPSSLIVKAAAAAGQALTTGASPTMAGGPTG
jgi:hypothetical protein